MSFHHPASFDSMFIGFDACCFDWDDGGYDAGAFSAVNNPSEARRSNADNNESSDEDGTMDCMTKNVMNFILLHQEEEGGGTNREDKLPVAKKRRKLCDERS